MKHEEMVKMMGEVVKVKKELIRHVGTDLLQKVTWREHVVLMPGGVKGRPGWVVGFRWLSNGHLKYDRFLNSNRFTPEGKKVFCLLVSYWPTMRPVKCLPESIEPTDESPYLATWSWTENDRRIMREEAKKMPRDKKGRFVKLKG